MTQASPFCVEWKEIIFHMLKPKFSIFIGKASRLVRRLHVLPLCSETSSSVQPCPSKFILCTSLFTGHRSIPLRLPAIFKLVCLFLRTVCIWSSWDVGKMGVSLLCCAVFPFPLGLCPCCYLQSAWNTFNLVWLSPTNLKISLETSLLPRSLIWTSQVWVTKPPPYPVRHTHHFVS